MYQESEYEVLGQIEREIGDLNQTEIIGQGQAGAVSDLLRVATEAASRGAEYGISKYEDKQRAEATAAEKRDAEARGQAAHLLDVAAVDACTEVSLAIKAAGDRAGADAVVAAKRAAAAAAWEAADRGAAGLPPLGAEARLAAARKLAEAAAKAWSAEAKNAYKAARSACARALVDRLSLPASGGGAAVPGGGGGESSFVRFMKAERGGLPTWSWFGIGAGVTAVVGGLAAILGRRRG